MKSQQNNDIWIDEKTRLPMHTHHSKSVRAIGKNGGVFVSYAAHDAEHCSCGISAHDIPLSAVQRKPTKGH
jgi:hypothetical protein